VPKANQWVKFILLLQVTRLSRHFMWIKNEFHKSTKYPFALEDEVGFTLMARFFVIDKLNQPVVFFA
jgi:hypothetical protein